MAWQMVEAGSAQELSLHKLAAALGVRAPSLYRYFANKDALLQAINKRSIENLTGALGATAAALPDAPPEARLHAMCRSYREYARAHPATYLLAFATRSAAIRPDDELPLELVLPLQAVWAQLAGEEHAVTAMYGAWALMHGFVMLELNAQFRRIESEQGFEAAISAYLRGWR